MHAMRCTSVHAVRPIPPTAARPPASCRPCGCVRPPVASRCWCLSRPSVFGSFRSLSSSPSLLWPFPVFPTSGSARLSHPAPVLGAAPHLPPCLDPHRIKGIGVASGGPNATSWVSRLCRVGILGVAAALLLRCTPRRCSETSALE
jgi:hypothetical protein